METNSQASVGRRHVTINRDDQVGIRLGTMETNSKA